MVYLTLAPVIYAILEAWFDSRQIRLNGSKDTLHEKWHAWNGFRRGLVLGFALLVSWQFMVFAIMAFGYTFTTVLNRFRGFHPWYASPDPRASMWDRVLVWKAKKLKVMPQSVSFIVHTIALIAAILLLIEKGSI